MTHHYPHDPHHPMHRAMLAASINYSVTHDDAHFFNGHDYAVPIYTQVLE